MTNADINGQRQKLLIAGFTMTQIENILDDEIEVMKTKCENSEVDFLFVLDGSGDRIDDSKESVLRYHIRESHFGLIWKDSLNDSEGSFKIEPTCE